MTLPPTLLLSDRDVARFLPMGDCVDAMREALRGVAEGTSVLPLRTALAVPGSPNLFLTMPAITGGATPSLGAKVISVFPGNDATPYDAHIGVVLLFDAEHGALLAIADASSITATRTAAVSGVATDHLARADARTLALLGAGVLALPHVDAVRTVREIARVQVWSRSPERVQAACARIAAAHPDLEVTAAPSARDAVTGADIVCTITASHTPVLEGAWLAPGTHVNAVGASVKTARELDSTAIAQATLVVDRRESAMAEAGDVLIPLEEGRIGPNHLHAELGEIVTGRKAGRTSRDERTVFKSLGLAVEDVVAVRRLYERAREAGAGVEVRLGGLREGHA